MIREVIGLARGEIGRNRVELHTQLSDGLPPVLADRVQLQQVMRKAVGDGKRAVRHGLPVHATRGWGIGVMSGGCFRVVDLMLDGSPELISVDE